MKKMFVLVFVFTTAAAFAQNSYDVGQRLSDAAFIDIPKQRCLTAAETIEPCLKVRTRGVVYTIGYRRKGRIISYLETHDASFATADALRVGATLSAEPGTLVWAGAFGEVVAPDTQDGWQPIVARDRTLRCENRAPTELGTGHDRNTEICQVRILGFKKRLVSQEQSRLAAAIR